MERKQSERIQTSIINALEKKALVWMAGKMPAWVNSDMLTFTGVFGAVIIMTGYILSLVNLNFLWLASLGFVINWFGDSLDGTLARVRNQQRPLYGFFIDHNIDCINEALMFIGIGISPMVNMNVALMVLAAYLTLSVSVYINSHLKNEFRLTYAKMGPTELRIIVIILNTLYLYVTPLREFALDINILGRTRTFGIIDFVAIVILVGLTIAYLGSLVKDAKYYAKLEPLKKDNE
ncbi:MAG: CDP-alcohol phosphatidyltransferase family protein [Bacteroidales bacterium]|nr:CDP-alcohol phosphatidyltransferase family protein [Bacteroidales bacterium]